MTGERNQTTASAAPGGFCPIAPSAACAGHQCLGMVEGAKDGKYPQPVKLGPRTTVWRVEEIRGLIKGALDKTHNLLF